MRPPFGWYPIFLREMLLFRRKLLRVSYLFSAMMVPLLYLAVFGFGLGGSVRVGRGDYLSFLIPGLVAMSSMNNAYSPVASALNLNRVYFKTFQIFVQAPVTAGSIVLAQILAGAVKGLFASLLIVVVGFLAAPGGFVTGPFVAALLVNCWLFAALGVIAGMVTRTHEDTATYNNFFILPMAFLGGTFFPVDRMPALLRALVSVLPLTHTNALIRSAAFDAAALSRLGVLLAYALAFSWYGTRLVRRYSE